MNQARLHGKNSQFDSLTLYGITTNNPAMQKKMFFLVTSYILMAVAVWCQNPAGVPIGPVEENKLPDVVVKMIKVQMFWDEGLSNPSGPRLRFERLADISNDQGHFFHYRVFAEGVPEGGPYRMEAWKIGTPVDSMTTLSENVYANRKGVLFAQKPKPEHRDVVSVDDHTDFDVAVRVSLGEPVRFVLSIKKSRWMVPGTLVAVPVEASDKGCTARALLSSPGGEVILISGEGFPPNSQVALDGDSAGEMLKAMRSVDSSGRIHWTELPYVTGKDNGILKDTITSPGCKVTLEIPWGHDNYRLQ
jgi:hypothetical protein